MRRASAGRARRRAARRRAGRGRPSPRRSRASGRAGRTARPAPSATVVGAAEPVAAAGRGSRSAPSVKAGRPSAPPEALSSSAAGRLLGALDVGLVERVDAEQPAGRGGRDLPEQHLRAERAADATSERGGLAVGEPVARGVVVGVADEPGHGDVGGRPARPRGRRRRPTTTGRMPVPSLPVDSAMSCSAQSANPTMPEPVVDDDELVAQRRRCRPWPRRGAAPGWPSSSAASRSATASASSSSASMSAPASPLGHQPERGQRGVAAADVRVGVDDAVAGLARDSCPAGCRGR